jgi:hypothetical protein
MGSASAVMPDREESRSIIRTYKKVAVPVVEGGCGGYFAGRKLFQRSYRVPVYIAGEAHDTFGGAQQIVSCSGNTGSSEVQLIC